MDEAQVAKLKVADLKKELKARGLAVTGNKNELVERLQEALSAGVGISGSMDDEEFDEEEILGGDMDSSQITPQEEEAALRGSTVKVKRGAAAQKTPAKKSVKVNLNRASEGVNAAASAPVVEAKVAVKKPISAVTTANSKGQENIEPPEKIVKVDEDAGEKTAFEKRAERFGTPMSDAAKKEARAARFGAVSNGTMKGNAKLTPFSGTVDVDKLKARAERFGEVTSKSLSKIDELEKRKQREERFGDAAAKKADDVSTDEAKAASTDEAKAASTDEAKAARAARFGATEIKSVKASE